MKREPRYPDWVKNDMVFICDGKGYCVTLIGATVCIGDVDNDCNPLDKNILMPEGVVDDSQTPLTSDDVKENPVTKHALNKNYAKEIVTQEFEDPITQKIVDLASRGKSCRQIEEILQNDVGVVMSYRTVARRLQGALPL